MLMMSLFLTSVYFCACPPAAYSAQSDIEALKQKVATAQKDLNSALQNVKSLQGRVDSEKKRRENTLKRMNEENAKWQQLTKNVQKLNSELAAATAKTNKKKGEWDQRKRVWEGFKQEEKKAYEQYQYYLDKGNKGEAARWASQVTKIYNLRVEAGKKLVVAENEYNAELNKKNILMRDYNSAVKQLKENNKIREGLQKSLQEYTKSTQESLALLQKANAQYNKAAKELADAQKQLSNATR